MMVIAGTSAGRAHPSQKHPHDAATLILLDRSGSRPKVLVGKRHENHVFMPGIFVFPGGRVEAGDGRVPVASPLPDHVEKRLLTKVPRPSAARARAYAMAAIRELAEETGLILGETTPEPPAALRGEWQMFGERGLLPSLRDVWFVARAVTPPGRARRYDTRFFAADAGRIAHSVDGLVHPEAELVELRWTSIEDTEHLNLSPITRLVLKELETRMEAGIDRDLPVPFFRRRFGSLVREHI